MTLKLAVSVKCQISSRKETQHHNCRDRLLRRCHHTTNNRLRHDTPGGRNVRALERRLTRRRHSTRRTGNAPGAVCESTTNRARPKPGTWTSQASRCPAHIPASGGRSRHWHQANDRREAYKRTLDLGATDHRTQQREAMGGTLRATGVPPFSCFCARIREKRPARYHDYAPGTVIVSDARPSSR